MDEKMYTVAEAAAAIGVSIPRLRRILNRPDYKDQVQFVTRQTRTGTRTAAVITQELYEQIVFEIAVPISVIKHKRKQVRSPSTNSVQDINIVTQLKQKDKRIAELEHALAIAQRNAEQFAKDLHELQRLIEQQTQQQKKSFFSKWLK